MNAIEKKQAFRDAAESIFQECTGQYITLFTDHFEKYSLLVKHLHSTLQTSQDGRSEDDNAAAFFDFEKKVRTWLSSLDELGEKLSADTFPDKLGAGLHDILDALPEDVLLDMPDSIWRPGPGDSFKASIIKRQARTAISIKTSRLALRNRIARILRREQAERVQPKRTFDQHTFVRYYLEIPILNAYINKIQNVIKIAVDQLSEVHENANELNRSTYTPDETTEPDAGPEESSGRTTLEILESYGESVSGVADTLETAFLESKSGFSELLDGIFTDFEKKWEIAGTRLLPGQVFSEVNYTDSMSKSLAVLEKNGKLWARYIGCEKGDWYADADLSILQFDAEIISDKTIRNIKGGIDEKIKPALGQADFIIQEYYDKFRGQAETPSPANDFVSHITTEKNALLAKLREITLTHIMGQILQVNITVLFQTFLGRIKSSIASIPDEHSIFETRDTRHIPPIAKVSNVALVELILTEVYNPMAARHKNSEQELQKKLQESMRAVAEIDQIVEYNMNASVSMLEDQPDDTSFDEAVKLVADGLERTRNQVGELVLVFDDISEKISSDIKALTADFRDGVQNMADNDKVLELKIKLARAKTREAIRAQIRTSIARSKRVVRSALPKVIELLKKAQKAYYRVLKVSGLAPISTLMDVKLSELLLDYQSMSSSLPYVYQKLFGVEPLTDARFFSSRDDEMAHFREVFSAWLFGKSLSISLVGERGSGKTTLLHFVREEIFTDTPIISVNLTDTIYTEEDLLATLKQAFDMPDVQDMDEFEEAILHRETRVICIFENLHNLFLRTVTGFEAIERFMLMMQKTGKSVFWVVTCALYGWQYLVKVLQAESYFSRTVELRMGDKAQIEDTIIKRHRVSGYILRFDASPDDQKSKAMKKLTSEDDRQNFLRERFFEQLSKLAAGNIRVAILFWLTSIKEITNDTMVLSPGIEFEHAFVYQLPPGELFTLAAIIQHEHLNAYMHSLVFNQNVNESHMVLNRMLQKGYLQQKDDQFSIHPFLYRPVVKALKSKNILQ